MAVLYQKGESNLKKLKSLICVALSLVMLMAVVPATPALAATENVTVVNLTWKRVFPAASNSLSKPIDGWVRIEAQNSGSTHLDIRMLDRNGNVVWSECCAVDYNEIRNFECGKNVYTIEAKSHYYGPINITNKNVTVIATKN